MLRYDKNDKSIQNTITFLFNIDKTAIRNHTGQQDIILVKYSNNEIDIIKLFTDI